MKESSSPYQSFMAASCVKKSFCSQILMYLHKKKEILEHENISILLTKGEDIMCLWCFCANASPPLISSHCFSTFFLAYLSSFIISVLHGKLSSESQFFQPGEGHGVPLPACDLGCLSYGNESVCVKTSPLWLMAKTTQSAAVSFNVSSY